MLLGIRLQNKLKTLCVYKASARLLENLADNSFLEVVFRFFQAGTWVQEMNASVCVNERKKERRKERKKKIQNELTKERKAARKK